MMATDWIVDDYTQYSHFVIDRRLDFTREVKRSAWGSAVAAALGSIG